jgi:hypothetical protein
MMSIAPPSARVCQTLLVREAVHSLLHEPVEAPQAMQPPPAARVLRGGGHVAPMERERCPAAEGGESLCAADGARRDLPHAQSFLTMARKGSHATEVHAAA